MLSRLRAAGVDVPVIVITGWDGDGDHEAAAEALGAAAFLRWPVDIDEVVATTLGLDDASADAQRAAVKRVRDRMFQRLRRLGGALGRRARRPRPVPPAASREKDHG